MNWTALLLCFLGPGGAAAEHRALHPADASYYVELPDVAGLVRAYRKTALLRLLRDEGLGQIVSALAKQEVDLEARAFASFFGLFGLSKDDHVLREARHVSVSVVLPGDDETWLNPGALGTRSFELRVVADFSTPLFAERAAGLIQSAARSTAPDLGSGMHRLSFGFQPDVSFLCGADGARVVLLAGKALGAFEERGAGLDASSQWEEALRHMPPGSGTTVVWLLTRRSPLDMVHFVFDLLGGPGLATPLERFRSLQVFAPEQVWRMQLDGGRFSSDLFTRDSGTPVFGFKRLDRSTLELVPAEAMAAYATTFDGSGWLKSIEKQLTPGHTLRKDLAQLEASGMRIERLLRLVGPRVIMFMHPPMGLAAPPTHVWLELKDRRAFERELESLGKGLSLNYPGIQAGKRDYRVKDARTGQRIAIPITTFSLPKDTLNLGGFISFSPTVAVLEDRVLIGLTSSQVKKELKRVHGEPGESYVARLPSALPQDLRSFLMMDWGMLVASVWELFRSLGGMLAGWLGTELPIDPSSLPSSDSFARYFEPTIDFTYAVEGGSMRHHVSSFGPELALAAAASTVGSMRTPDLGLRAPAAPLVEQRDVAAGREHAVTRSRLEDIRRGLRDYYRENSRLPKRLAEIVRPTARFPAGFLAVGRDTKLDPTGIPLDGWGHPFHYSEAGAGDEYLLWSRGPNGIAEDGQADDVTLE